MSEEIMQTCNMDERTNEEKLLDTIAELQNSATANRVFKSSDEKLIERLIAETADQNTRIASLTSQLALQDEWVSVEDRLPEDAKPVIVSGGCGHYSHKYKRWFTNMERDNFGEYRPIQWEVRHWMKIPSPPVKAES